MPPADTVSAYLAPEGFVDQVAGELAGVEAVHGRLVVARGAPQTSRWAANVWRDAREIPVGSISEAARALRAIQRNWAAYTFRWHRRGALIQARLPHVSARPLVFPGVLPAAPLGSWTLLTPERLLASGDCSSPFAHGEARFVESRHGPPNRAYLKLWEALTLCGARPAPGERCLDAGASPGGWTWVLQQLGASVLAVDRAPLAPGLAEAPGVTFRRGDAFALTPARDGPFDWIFCDVACYPERLLAWLEPWLASGACRHAVCTVKFQGEGHYGAIRDFAALPHTFFRHLFHNKHELTWVSLGAGGGGRGMAPGT